MRKVNLLIDGYSVRLQYLLKISMILVPSELRFLNTMKNFPRNFVVEDFGRVFGHRF